MVTSEWAGQSVVKMASYHSHPSPPIGVSFVDSSVRDPKLDCPKVWCCSTILDDAQREKRFLKG